jgi:hypothetical protein
MALTLNGVGLAQGDTISGLEGPRELWEKGAMFLLPCGFCKRNIQPTVYGPIHVIISSLLNISKVSPYVCFIFSIIRLCDF